MTALLRVAAIVFCLLTAQLMVAAPLDWSYSLFPSADISGMPGSTIGWGYRITNDDPTFWLVPLFLDSDPFLNATPFSIFDFPIVAPLQTITVPFNEAAFQGLYELTWDLTAPLGFVNSGTFMLVSDFYTDDPLQGGVPLFLESTRTVAYQATVGPPSDVPEPALWVPTLVAVAVGAACRRRKSRLSASSRTAA